MQRALANGNQVCVTVTLVDGRVLAHAAFHHSMNYRSVVVFGTASVVKDATEKTKALLTFSEHVIPGRWAEVREPTEGELPLRLVTGAPISDPRLRRHLQVPAYVRSYQMQSRGRKVS